MRRSMYNKYQSIHAFINCVAVRKNWTLDDVIRQEIEFGKWDTEVLEQPHYEIDWSVPKWARRWDVVLFMHTKTSIDNIKSLESKYNKTKDVLSCQDQKYIETALKRAKAAYDRVGNTIYAIGFVKRMIPKESGDKRFYAWIRNVIPLEVPVNIDEVRGNVNVNSGIIPVYRDNYERIKKAIIEANPGIDFPNRFLHSCSEPIIEERVNRYNWIDVGQKFRLHFLLEEAFRTGYVNYLLRSITRKRIYAECDISGLDGKIVGRVDNVIKFGDKYLPVEVKINNGTESQLKQQLKKYCNADHIKLGKEGHVIAKKEIYSTKVLEIDLSAINMYDFEEDSLEEIYLLKDLTSRDEIDKIKDIIAKILHVEMLSEPEKREWKKKRRESREWQEISDLANIERQIIDGDELLIRKGYSRLEYDWDLLEEKNNGRKL